MVGEREFLSFVAGVMDVSADGLSLETGYGEIPEWDSVMQLRLTMEIEAKYGVDVPIDRVADIKTLGCFYEYVKAK